MTAKQLLVDSALFVCALMVASWTTWAVIAAF
jgi:hypothetical protein